MLARRAGVKILVIGMGGVGTMAAVALKAQGHVEITSVCRSRLEERSSTGWTIDSVDHGQITAWRPDQLVSEVISGPWDFVIIATKNIPDAPGQSIVDMIRPVIDGSGSTAIVLLQNGLEIEKPFIQAFPGCPIISGISLIGAIEQPNGTILHTVHDELVVGPFTDYSVDAAQRFHSLYSASSKVTCIYDDRTRYWRWRKLIYNASFNSVAAITGLDVSRIRFSEHVVDSLVRPIMKEILLIAASDGVEIEAEIVESLIVIDPYDAFFVPSMAQDIARGNLIEYENIVGAPLRVAGANGIAAPTLQVVYHLLKALQWRNMERFGYVTVPAVRAAGMKYG